MTKKERKALNLASEAMFIDGAHHKQWYLDQIVRVLTGDGYNAYVRNKQNGKNGPETYLWDKGIAP